MPRPELGFYYGNVMAGAIGRKHGITEKQLDSLLKTLPKKAHKLRYNPETTNWDRAYRKLPYDKQTSQQVNKLVKKFKKRSEVLVVFGIGGSALGNIALQTALNPYMSNLDDNQRIGPRIFVFDNIDPSQIASFLKWLKDSKKLKNTIFNVISRSGTAAETMSQLMIIRRLLTHEFGARSLRNHIIVTTCFGDNPLYRIATNEHLSCLEIPRYVGGRFSVLSTVGLFSAAMCGIDIDSLLAGARAMDRKVRRTDLNKNPAAINAAINYHFYKKDKKISVMMPYSYHLKDLADWYRQLWAESLGKAYDLKGSEVYVGPTPVKALGATDQHSQLQLYLEGPNDKLFTFLQVDKFKKDLRIKGIPPYTPELDYLEDKYLGELLNNEKKATEYTLLNKNRPCLTVIFPEVNPYTVGQFIYFYEATTSFTGAFFGINPYNQPSVKLIRDAIPTLKGKTGYYKPGLTYEQWAKEIRSKTEFDKKFLV
jgi:glucose-6-phosphate isomerase